MTRTFLLFDAAASQHAFHLLQLWLDEEIEAEEDTDEEVENAEREDTEHESESSQRSRSKLSFSSTCLIRTAFPLQITYCKFDHTEL